MLTVAALFCSSSLLCISNSNWATENEVGRSVSVNGNDEPAGEICHQYTSVVTAIIPYSRTIKLQYTVLGDYWECVRPARLPVLTWVPSSDPLGTTSKICSPPGPFRIQRNVLCLSLILKDSQQRSILGHKKLFMRSGYLLSSTETALHSWSLIYHFNISTGTRANERRLA